MQRPSKPHPLGLRAIAARRRLLDMHHDAKVGHIGGNLSALDAMLCLHSSIMEEHDVFVLSKGHAAGALYVTLWAQGLLTDADLKTFHKDGTRLAGHPVAGWHDRIAFATGSLGHGLGLATGVALGKKLRAEPGRVFCLLSDGECQEGSTWEAAILAQHQKLSNLVVLVDANGLQGFGTTADVASMDNLATKIAGFGLETREIDGHSEHDLTEVLRHHAAGPLVVVMRTIKGRGISFMENKMEWHYLPLSDDLHAQAVAELAAQEAILRDAEAAAKPVRRPKASAKSRRHAEYAGA